MKSRILRGWFGRVYTDHFTAEEWGTTENSRIASAQLRRGKGEVARLLRDIDSELRKLAAVEARLARTARKRLLLTEVVDLWESAESDGAPGKISD